MIDKKSDFIIVRGRHPTDDEPFGDLDRIALPFPLLAKRMGRLLMGVDVAWLQECAAERDYIRGVIVDNDLKTFSVFVLRDPIAAVATSVKRWPNAGKRGIGRWVETPDIGGGDNVFECEETIGDSGVVDIDLVSILDAKGLLVKGPTMPIPGDLGDYDYYEMGGDIRGARILALERAMRDFVYVVVPCSIPQTFQAEVREGDAKEYETLVGTRAVYEEYRSWTYDSDKKVWKTDRHYKLTAKIVVLGGMAIDFPRRTYGGRPVAKRVTPWYLVSALHFRPASGTVERWFYVKGEVFNAAPSMTQYVIEVILSRLKGQFDMGDLTAKELEQGQLCSLKITVGGVWCLAEMRDDVVELE